MDAIRIDLTVPDCWEKLTPAQVVYVAHQYLCRQSREELLTRCFLKFSGIKLLHHYPDNDTFDFSCQGKPFKLEANDFKVFCEQLAYLVDGIGLMPCPAEVAGLSAPDRRLYGVTLEEYLTADNYYVRFARTKEGLNEMIASLYRRKNEPYNDALAANRLPAVRKEKAAVKYAVFLWYTGVKAWLRDKYPLVFGAPEETGDTPADELVFGLLESLNDGRPQDNALILKTHVHEVLYSLNARIERANELKSK